jgi:outer membrane autotransporter protein
VAVTGDGGLSVGAAKAIDTILANSNNSPAAQAFAAVVEPELAALTPVQQVKALSQMAPSGVITQFSVTSSTANAQVIATVNGQQFSFAALAQGRQYASLGDDYYGEGSGMPSRGLWGKILGGGSTADVSGGSPFSASVFGAVVGADLVKTDQLYGGVAFSWVGAWAAGKGDLAGSNSHLNSYQITAYGSAVPNAMDHRLSVDGQIAIGLNRYDQSRRIDFLNSTARSNYNGEQYVGSLRVGYAFIGKTVTLTPYAGINEAHLVNHGYTENGAGLADMTVNTVTTDTFQHDIGVRIDGSMDLGSMGTALPSLKVGWGHTYDNGPVAISGQLAGVAFASSSARPSADGALISAGIVLQKAGRISFGLEYDGDLRKDFQSNTGSVKVTWKF